MITPLDSADTSLPENFQISPATAGIATYFEITTTATFQGPVTLGITYQGFPDALAWQVSGGTPNPAVNPRLLHYDLAYTDPVNGSHWKDITTSVDVANQKVYGETTSFSPFAVVSRPAYSWSGVLQPVNPNGSSIFKLGSTVPVKYQLTGDDAGIANLQARLYVAKVSSSVVGTEINIAPTDEMPVLRMDAGVPTLERMRWGLVPFWATDLKVGVKMINARCEAIQEKPAFRKAIRTRRCLVPASGFYEWITLSVRVKQPMHIHRADGKPLVFAGVWEEWGPKDAPTRTYSVITTAANALMEPIHNRMPVILSGEAARAWLDPRTETARACQLLQPCPSEWLEAFAVNRAVGRVGYDAPDCLEPIELSLT